MAYSIQIKIKLFFLFFFLIGASGFYAQNKKLDRLEQFYNQSEAKKVNVNKFYKSFKNLNVNKILEIGLHSFLKDFIKKLSFFYINLEQKYFIGIEK